MNNLQSFSIKETREQLSHLIDQVAIAHRQFLITKFGKPKAMLTPIVSLSQQNKKKEGLLVSFGAWKNRIDIKDSAKWVSDLRHQMSSRDGKILS
ncbi:type II toxin-antitoxin system Phd/YefM family antitoxin [Candidatus Gottesmanbacteria bacterium]|nr:type II toxin-antitoxin system Phd/YefM family antitoxin [Candidatus Gottesmanbacteria bacterium]MBI5452712.1 type II toxin-antitoxin system Phd/YefM family antitoxin [Candidatus Gottesmanbacteria bacterium]